jgi:hypothetical protein
VTAVELRYRPTGFGKMVGISLAAVGAAVLVLVTGGLRSAQTGPL